FNSTGSNTVPVAKGKLPACRQYKTAATMQFKPVEPGLTVETSGSIIDGHAGCGLNQYKTGSSFFFTRKKIIDTSCNGSDIKKMNGLPIHTYIHATGSVDGTSRRSSDQCC